MPIQILPENPSFGNTMARNFGAGLSKGLENSADFYTKLGVEKYKQKQRKSFLEEIEGKNSNNYQSPGRNIEKEFLEALPKIEQSIGRELTPQDIDQLWEGAQKAEDFSHNPSQMNQSQSQDPFLKAKKYAALGEHELASVAKAEAEQSLRSKESKTSRNWEIGKSSLLKANEESEKLPQKQMALDSMKEAIQGGDLGFFSKDNLAELTGIEGLRSPKGAIFKTAAKEFFLGNMSRVGARGLNQWMEKTIDSMSPKLGRSTEANLAVTEILQAELDVTQKQIDLTNEIAEKYESQTGEIPRNLSVLVSKELSKYAVERQKQAKSKIEEIEEIYSPLNKEGQLMYAPNGDLRRVPAKDIKEAKKEGYRAYQR